MELAGACSVNVCAECRRIKSSRDSPLPLADRTWWTNASAFHSLADIPSGQFSGAPIGIWAPIAHSSDHGKCPLGWFSFFPVSVSLTCVSWDHPSHKLPAPKPLSQALLSEEAQAKTWCFLVGFLWVISWALLVSPSCPNSLQIIDYWSLLHLWKSIVLFGCFFPSGDVFVFPIHS